MLVIMESMARYQRSPNYPRTSLPKAISRLKKYRSSIDQQIFTEAAGVAHRLGYSGVTGASVPILSSLKKFGLLDVLPRGFRFSDKALEIINLTEKDQRYADLVEELAFTPELYAEIQNHFGKKFPNDAKLKDFLSIKNFVPKIIPSVIDIYRQTYDLVASVKNDYERNSKGSGQKDDDHQSVAPAKQTTLADQEWKFNISDGIEVSVRFTVAPSIDSINKLSDFWKNNERFWKENNK